MAVNRGTRKHITYGVVKDVHGFFWDVRETRATKHGFDLYFGYRESYIGGPPKLIATPELVDFWKTNRIKSSGFLFSLPAGRTTLKRLRRKLGFNQNEDWEKFWQDRMADLATLKSREFAAKHRVTRHNAADRRTRMVGHTARPLGWWRKPQTLKLLLSNLTLREIGEKLGIKTSQVCRLQKQAEELFRCVGE